MRIIEKITQNFEVDNADYLTLSYEQVGYRFDRIVINEQEKVETCEEGNYYSLVSDWLDGGSRIYLTSSPENKNLFDKLRYRKVRSNDITPIKNYPEKWNGTIELTYWCWKDIEDDVVSIASFKTISDYSYLFGCEDNHKQVDYMMADLVMWLSERVSLTEKDSKLLEEIVESYKQDIEAVWMYG